MIKTKSQLAAKGFTQAQDVDYHETTSPKRSSAPVKTTAVIANKLGLLVFNIEISQEFVQPPLKEEIDMLLPRGCSELLGKIVKLLRHQHG